MTEFFHVTGPPGTGKTTYLAEQARQAILKRGSHRIAIVSLTRAAAREIGGRGLDVPEEQIGTLHSFCFRAAGSPDIADRKIPEWNEENPGYKLPIPKYDENQIDDQDLNNMNESVDSDERAENCFNSMNLYRHQMIDRKVWRNSVIYFTEKWEEWKAEHGYMDFTDLIEYGLENMDCAPGVPEVLMVDECQDMSALEIALIHKWAESTDILIQAGDPDQAIYTWRGANPNVFIEHEIPEENKKYLRRTWRLSFSVHKYIRKWISHILRREDVEFEPREELGGVDHLGADYLEPDEIVDICREQFVEGKTTMVLTSCGYMLDNTIKLLKDEGIPFHNPFSLKNAKWNPLLKINKRVMPVDRIEAFLRPHESNVEEQREWTREDIQKWMALIKSKGFLTHGTKAYIASESFTIPKTFDEFSSFFINPADAEKANNLDLQWYLDSVLSSRRKPLIYPAQIADKRGARALSETPGVTVGTIHSVKGGEADTVIICPDLSMSGWNHYETEDGHDDVIRVFYVGLTRAKDRLLLCNPCSTRAVQW